ncbi:MAG: UDP-N-acetylmuramoyl-tripeptide--D-alanyl-D-alanine ligase [Bacteroidia bacterium]|nr:UDP-N-acetylmuramoyl-tripeptide--D-alanyl-D-alanine ligase [Bacteroidia bacterium]
MNDIKNIYEFFLKVCRGKICTDTRKLESGSLFFALKGENFDGNKFVPEALNNGCKGAVASDMNLKGMPNVFVVEDTLKTLQDLAHIHRKTFRFPVIGIGGSNGKTTHKELIHAVLSKKYRCVATKGNLNNHVGVPLTLLSVDAANTDMLILEMGANHQGEYALLCRIAEPDYALITNIGRDHLEGFGGLEGVRKGNGELYDFIRDKKRKIFLNTDDKVLREMATGIEYVGYGSGAGSIVKGWAVEEDPLLIKFKTVGREEEFELKTHFAGSHYLPNIMSAVCMGLYWKVPVDQIIEAIEGYIPGMNRSQKIRTHHNEILLDAYNANPDSMEAAINSFLKSDRQNKFLILGDMFELGSYAAQEHQKICDIIKEKNFHDVFLVGKEFENCRTDFMKFPTTEDCMHYLKQHPLKNKYILLKGSRGMQLERLKEVL